MSNNYLYSFMSHPGIFIERRGFKQDTLAQESGDDWTQSKVSHLEIKETIDPAILEQVAKVLKVPVEAIKNFDESAAISIVANNFTDFKDNAIASAMNYQCTFNPIDKIIDRCEGKIELYERMLKEKNEMLEKLLAKKK